MNNFVGCPSNFIKCLGKDIVLSTYFLIRVRGMTTAVNIPYSSFTSSQKLQGRFDSAVSESTVDSLLYVLQGLAMPLCPIEFQIPEVRKRALSFWQLWNEYAASNRRISESRSHRADFKETVMKRSLRWSTVTTQDL